MSNITINNPTDIGTGAVGGDYIPLWDVSASQMKRVTVTNLLNVLGAPVLASPNTFTATQIVAPTATGSDGLVVTMPASTTRYGLLVRDHLLGSRFFVQAKVDAAAAFFNGGDFGNNVEGPYIQLTRNSNATKPGTAFLSIMNRAGTLYRVWPDASGNLRIHTANPIYDNDGLGTVIGTQTSSRDAKNIIGAPISTSEALRNIVQAADAVQRFTYKTGAFDGEEFSGLIIDDAPRYGMDRDAGHPAGKSLNAINAIGDLMLAVKEIATRLGVESNA